MGWFKIHGFCDGFSRKPVAFWWFPEVWKCDCFFWHLDFSRRCNFFLWWCYLQDRCQSSCSSGRWILIWARWRKLEKRSMFKGYHLCWRPGNVVSGLPKANISIYFSGSCCKTLGQTAAANISIYFSGSCCKTLGRTAAVFWCLLIFSLCAVWDVWLSSFKTAFFMIKCTRSPLGTRPIAGWVRLQESR